MLQAVAPGSSSPAWLPHHARYQCPGPAPPASSSPLPPARPPALLPSQHHSLLLSAPGKEEEEEGRKGLEPSVAGSQAGAAPSQSSQPERTERPKAPILAILMVGTENREPDGAQAHLPSATYRPEERSSLFRSCLVARLFQALESKLQRRLLSFSSHLR